MTFQQAIPTRQANTMGAGGTDRGTSFGRGWIPASRDIGLPGEHGRSEHGWGAGDEIHALPDPGFVFTDVPAVLPYGAFSPERRIRFLDALAANGNVRAACALVGISAQAAYKARRRDVRFAAGWDAALLLAREHAEAVLADRALNGVEEVVYYRGEAVGRRVKFDNRLLLALLGRLDRRCGDARAELAAERFDEILAAIGGAQAAREIGAEMAEAASFASEQIGLGASRLEYREWAMERAAEEADAAGLDADAAAELEDDTEAEADARFDDWEAQMRVAVDDALGDDAPDEGLAEMLPDGAQEEGAMSTQDSVNPVNLTPAEGEAGEDDYPFPEAAWAAFMGRTYP